jgi:hypothetical protein
VEFKRMLPIGAVGTVTAKVDGVVGAKVSILGRLEGDDGALYAKCAGLFIKREPEDFGRYATYARMAKQALVERSD